MNKIIHEKNHVLRWLQEQGGSFANLKYGNLSQSYLRAEKALGTQGNVEFKVTETAAGGTSLVTENLLKNNDLFVMTELAICYRQIAADTATDELTAESILHTYVNPNVFSGTNSVNMAAIPNGKFSLSVNQVEWIPAIPVRDFERVGTSQQGTTTTASVNTSTADATTTIARDEKTSGNYGYYPTGLISFAGTDKVKPVVDWGVSLNMDDSSLTNYLVLLMKGYLVSNYK